MTPLPKRRHSSRRQGKRTAAIKLKGPQLITCPQCQARIQAHQVCPNCGYYKGKEVIKIKVKKAKKE